MSRTTISFACAVGMATSVAFLTPPSALAYATTATVVKVVDGDTVGVEYSDGRDDTVRILGIDTPETKHPDKPVECWGPEATAFATTELAGRVVTLSTDPTQDERDRYRRQLAVVDRDGWNYSIEAARAGVARAYIYDDKPVTIYPQIHAAQQQAQAAGRGLWGPPCNGAR
ncbi:thermonuclease family protein [Nocardia aurea]|uniref:thermonuclease family protein n=1 Tax=Nocardia aurea TaxID=2144174 RepID=UPI001E2A77B1|nr:thermonuclease family protein [Nocardia aurea]